jgi:hypothetical protein
VGGKYQINSIGFCPPASPTFFWAKNSRREEAPRKKSEFDLELDPVFALLACQPCSAPPGAHRDRRRPRDHPESSLITSTVI